MKRLFSHPRMAAGLVRLLGDDWVDDLDLDRLERLPTDYVSDNLRSRRADLPWWAPFKPDADRPAGAGVMFHIEFQSSPDAHMVERLLEYVALRTLDVVTTKVRGPYVEFVRDLLGRVLERHLTGRSCDDEGCALRIGAAGVLEQLDDPCQLVVMIEL